MCLPSCNVIHSVDVYKNYTKEFELEAKSDIKIQFLKTVYICTQMSKLVS